jgi:hypothetical protein
MLSLYLRLGIVSSDFPWTGNSLGSSKSLKYNKPITFEVFMALKISTEVFGVTAPCSLVVGYQRLGGIYCLLNILS